MESIGDERPDGRVQMPPLPDSSDHDATWGYLESGIHRILADPGTALDVQSYSGLYAAIFNYTTTGKVFSKSGKGSNPKASVHISSYTLGEDLYLRLNTCLERYTQQLANTSRPYQNGALLKFYIEEWQRFTKSARLINRIFQYFNRHWLLREAYEGKHVPHDTYTICLVRWDTGFYQPVADDLAKVIGKLPEKCRNGEIIEPGEIHAIVENITEGREDKSWHIEAELLSKKLRESLHSCLGVDYESLRDFVAKET